MTFKLQSCNYSSLASKRNNEFLGVYQKIGWMIYPSNKSIRLKYEF